MNESTCIRQMTFIVYMRAFILIYVSRAGYSENFCDAIEEIHDTFMKAGCKMVK